MGGNIFFNHSVLLVYSADVDTRPEDGGGIWFRNVTSPETMERALTDVQRAYPHVSSIDSSLIVTWDHVGYASLHTDKVIIMIVFTWL